MSRCSTALAVAFFGSGYRDRCNASSHCGGEYTSGKSLAFARAAVGEAVSAGKFANETLSHKRHTTHTL